VNSTSSAIRKPVAEEPLWSGADAFPRTVGPHFRAKTFRSSSRSRPAFYEFRSANVVNNQDTGPNFKLDSLVFQIADRKPLPPDSRTGRECPAFHAPWDRGLQPRYSRGVVRRHREKCSERPARAEA
jgi:hypothetical protein